MNMITKDEWKRIKSAEKTYMLYVELHKKMENLAQRIDGIILSNFELEKQIAHIEIKHRKVRKILENHVNRIEWCPHEHF